MPTSALDVLPWAGKRQLDSIGLDVRWLAFSQTVGTCSQIVACNGCGHISGSRLYLFFTLVSISPLLARHLLLDDHRG
jgi:hypothetical protein